MHTTVKFPSLDNGGRDEIDCGAGVTRLEANAEDLARLDALRKNVEEVARGAVKIES